MSRWLGRKKKQQPKLLPLTRAQPQPEAHPPNPCGNRGIGQAYSLQVKEVVFDIDTVS
jgi:hypothetical protein